MKRLIALLGVICLLWWGWWFWSSWQMRSDIQAWFDARRAEGWQARYDDVTLRGFPNRLDVTFTGLHLEDPNRGVIWETDLFQILSLSYKPGHHILVWEGDQALTLPSGRFDITSDAMRASLIRDGALITRINLEADILNIDGPSRSMALAGMRTAWHRQADQTYGIGLAADAVARTQSSLPLGSGRVDGLQMRALWRFDGDWGLGTLAGKTPQPEHLDLKELAYRFEGLELNLAGQADITRTGRLTGEMALRAVNWQEMLDRAVASNHIPQGLAETLRSGLSLVAGLKGRADTLDVPLVFQAGEMWVGPLPLGPAPILRLP